MTEAVTPPVKSGGSTTPAITEGVQARLRRLREVINAFSGDLREMERLEKALVAATDRLDRHSQRKAVQPVSLAASVDRVEEDLATLTSSLKAS
jgi:hypothetical protein